MKKRKNLRRLLPVLLAFLIILTAASFSFILMNRRITSLNEKLVQDIGETYLSALSMETVNHATTYFEGKFDILEQMLDTLVNQMETPEQLKESLDKEISAGSPYVALLTKDGQRDVVRGDESFRPYDERNFQKALENVDHWVVLTINEQDERMIELMLIRDFSVGDQEYCALLFDLPVHTLNEVLNLAYNEEMVYSFLVRKQDSGFVVRNEGATAESYYDRVKKKYEPYEGKTADDYITEINAIMQTGEMYCSIIIVDGEERMMFARQFVHSDWYLLTFMRLSEMEDIFLDNNQARTDAFIKYFMVLLVICIFTFALFALYSYRHLMEMERLKNEAIAANKYKSEFLSNMSHDIRTPMNIIVGMTDIARANIDDKERVSECLNKITKSSRHLLSLINDVLDMSKIESGKMTLSEVQFSLREGLENIVAIIQPQIKSKKQQFDIYIQDVICEEVYCDNLRLNQVLINLLSNAVKYTQEGGSISLTLRQEAVPGSSEYVRNHFYVSDNGIGMTQDFIAVLFDSFVREDKERVTKEEGTGLGLAITKHIVDVMQGTIEVDSTPGKGSEFHVVLDLKRGDTEAADMNLDELRVLVVDDDPDLCLSAVYALKELGAQAQSVNNGEEAIALIKQSPQHFDIILVDWQMPDMDGVDTTRRIREHTGSDVPVILISAYDWADFEKDARTAGVNGFISKPLFKSTLFFGIQKIMEKNHDSEPEEKPSVGFSGERILIAEDNELNSEIAVTILTNAGLTVDCTENGRLCADKFAVSPEGYYRAILMDIRMPVMNGYEATKVIRAMERADADIPIIAMTADAFSEDIAKAAECGMNGHVAKPLDMNTLFYLLRREMEKSGQTDTPEM